MNFLKYRDGTRFLEETGLSVEQGLIVIEKELDRLKGE
jgi:hypothetical protein